MSDQTPPVFDASTFSIDSYVKRIEKPWGYELHWVPADAPYMGKVLHLNEGGRLSLQVHDAKQESWFIIGGNGAVIWEDAQGTLVETILQPGVGYSTKIGQKHRLVGLSGGCDIIEASTPELGTTWRLDDDYARPHETPGQRAKERGEVSA